MGIYNFWTWFNNNFKGCINKLSEGQDFKSININIDNLLIDMNGIFHNSAQKIYEYGNHRPKKEKYKLTSCQMNITRIKHIALSI